MQPQSTNNQSQIDLNTLSIEQLKLIHSNTYKNLISQQQSFQQLQTLLFTTNNCRNYLDNCVSTKSNEPKKMLIPLTGSVFVNGYTTDSKDDLVLIDIGTDYFVYKKKKDAVSYYNRKYSLLNDKKQKLETLLNSNNSLLKTIEHVLATKQTQPK